MEQSVRHPCSGHHTSPPIQHAPLPLVEVPADAGTGSSPPPASVRTRSPRARCSRGTLRPTVRAGTTRTRGAPCARGRRTRARTRPSPRCGLRGTCGPARCSRRRGAVSPAPTLQFARVSEVALAPCLCGRLFAIAWLFRNPTTPMY